MSIVWPILYAIFIWWFSTGIILLLNQRNPSTYKNTFWVSGMVLALALVGLKTSANLSTVAGAYCGFTCAILVWGWQEIGFLFGYVTGPRREPCPEDCRGLQKMYFAFQTIQHHEIALVVLALAGIAALTAHAADAPFDEKACMKKCTKGFTEKAQNAAKEEAQDKGEQVDNKSLDRKVDKPAIKKQCEFICKDNG